MWFICVVTVSISAKNVSSQVLLTSAFVEKAFRSSAVPCVKNHPALFVGGDCFKAHVKQQ